MSPDDMASEPPKPTRRLLAILIQLLGVALFSLALVWLHQWTRDRIIDQDRYRVAFSEIDCPPPPDESRGEFLAEVQYLGGLPERLHLLDETLPSRLREAFACHPSVEKVVEVKILPPRHVQVRLKYRAPERTGK